MEPVEYAFLTDVIGKDGAEALKKAAVKSTQVEAVLVPRTVIAWLNLMDGFEGRLPGTDFKAKIAKNEDSFSGFLQTEMGLCEFEDIRAARLAAMVSVALGSDVPPNSDLKDIDLIRLGKSIDLLAKSHFLLKEAAREKKCDCCKEKYKGISCKCKAEKKEAVPQASTEGQPEPHGAPTVQAPGGPIGPSMLQGSGGKHPQNPIARKSERVTKITKSQSLRSCSVCGKQQFHNDKFVGCYCLAALAKHVKVTKVDTEYHMRFASTLDADSILTILDVLRGA